ncbi:hypothetical protein BV898_05372 [Hypsibius exemplaris]|uniref:Transmembrane protein n=1 Tax=Hypsibius exemplaris TaxID=2072580 RepID=A0A1W0WZA9_HYPEX|nr:hypothetical protein BV898_05372 [Hypsibius exemplaris]
MANVAMDRNAKLLAVTVVLYLIIVVLGFPQAIGIGLAVARLHGCPLFTEFTGFGPMFGSYHNCSYVTYMPVVVSIVYGVIQLISHAYALYQAIRRPEIIPRMSVAGSLVGALLGLILTLIGAGLTTGGLYYFCLSNRALMIQYFGRPITCVSGEATPLLFRGYDPYPDLTETEVSYWLSVLVWLILVIVTAIRATAARREQTDGGSSRPGETFRGVTLIPDRFKKGTRLVETIPSSGGQERSSMAQFETKTKPMETAA